jgi:hypothetical protein
MKDVLELLSRYDVSLLGLTEQRNALATSIEALAAVFEPELQQRMTEVLADLDAKRDSLFIGIKHLLEGNAHHFNTTKQEAGKRLLFHLQSYGKNIPYMNYQAETAVIASMLSEWQTETNLQEAVVLLQLSEWVATLQDANTQFNEQYLRRVKETATADTPSFSSLRTHAKTDYRALVARINAFMTLDTDATYAKLYQALYELARQYNQVVKVRSNI